MRGMLRSSILALALASCSTGPDGGYWPQWRGPKRDNISTETGLLKEWPPEGPPLAWQVEGIGTGISGIVVAGGRVFAMGFIDDQEYLSALDETTGRRLWSAPIGTKRGLSDNPLMRWLSQRAPTVDEDRIFSFSGDGRLTCLDVRDGREIWRKSHPDDLGGRQPYLGFCDYPLVDRDHVITVVSGSRPAMVALDRKTGDVLWRTATPEITREDGYDGEWAATVVTEGGGVRQYVSMMRHGVFGFRASDGKLLWSYNQMSSGSYRYVRTPLVAGDRIVLLGGNAGGMAGLKLVPSGDGVGVEQQYSIPRNSQLFTQDSAVAEGGVIYAIASQGWLQCFDGASGKPLSRLRLEKFRTGSFVYNQGNLYAHGSDGTLARVAVSPEIMNETGRFRAVDRKDSSGATIPVIAGGKLYLRSESRLLAYQLQDGAPTAPIPAPIMLPAPVRPPAAGPAIPPHAEFVPTPQDVVRRMLETAQVTKSDTVVDLGSGDGRIVIAAARDYGARAVGYEIEDELVKVSRRRIKDSGLEALATIEQKDLYTADLSAATVVALYLPGPFLEKLKPQLEKLKPGARIVSHQFMIPGFIPDRSFAVEPSEDGNPHYVHLWTVPLRKEPR